MHSWNDAVNYVDKEKAVMEIEKRTGALLACTAGLAISLSVLALFHASALIIQQVAVQCAARTSDICRQFIPWLWTGIAFALIAAVASIMWFSRRTRFTSWLTPIVFAALLSLVVYSIWLWVQPSEENYGSPPATEISATASATWICPAWPPDRRSAPARLATLWVRLPCRWST